MLTRTGVLSAGKGLRERVRLHGIVIDIAWTWQRRCTEANVVFLFFSVLDPLALTFAVYRLRYRIPPATWCLRMPLQGVGGVIRILGRGGCISRAVCLLPSSTGNGFCNFVGCPVVLVPLDDWDSWVIVDLLKMKQQVAAALNQLALRNNGLFRSSGILDQFTQKWSPMCPRMTRWNLSK